ncbi:BRCA1-associated RING domain protein 1 [Dispira parvispora]|uniref:BRCA1-associated RING domain protein 1 n=1 Tax=Dispira parvispora TaxID=1520584 RepID=A0A9W8E4Z3_9FUNG|nr:BRCA1-associated RING domain protein 1 [Dispira parvispora]
MRSTSRRKSSNKSPNKAGVDPNAKLAPMPGASPSSSSGSSEKLPTTLSGLLSRMQSEITCVICLGTLDQPCTTHCNHIFCRDCISRSLDIKNNGCPLCKAPITKRSLAENDSFGTVVQAVSGVITAYENIVGSTLQSQTSRYHYENLTLAPDPQLSQTYPHPTKETTTSAIKPPIIHVDQNLPKGKTARTSPPPNANTRKVPYRHPRSSPNSGEAEKRPRIRARKGRDVPPAPTPPSNSPTVQTIPKSGTLSSARIASSGLSSEHQNLLARAQEELGADVTSTVDSTVTHLVMETDHCRMVTRRTKKYLLALVCGCWIVDFAWLRGCLDHRKWLPEDSYQVQGDRKSNTVGGPQRAHCAIAAQQDKAVLASSSVGGESGSTGSPTLPRLLFSECYFILDSKFSPTATSLHDIRMFISMAGGTLIDSAQEASLLQHLQPTTTLPLHSSHPDLVYIFDPNQHPTAKRNRWEAAVGYEPSRQRRRVSTGSLITRRSTKAPLPTTTTQSTGTKPTRRSVASMDIETSLWPIATVMVTNTALSSPFEALPQLAVSFLPLNWVVDSVAAYQLL